MRNFNIYETLAIIGTEKAAKLYFDISEIRNTDQNPRTCRATEQEAREYISNVAQSSDLNRRIEVLSKTDLIRCYRLDTHATRCGFDIFKITARNTFKSLVVSRRHHRHLERQKSRNQWFKDNVADVWKSLDIPNVSTQTLMNVLTDIDGRRQWMEIHGLPSEGRLGIPAVQPVKRTLQPEEVALGFRAHYIAQGGGKEHFLFHMDKYPNGFVRGIVEEVLATNPTDQIVVHLCNSMLDGRHFVLRRDLLVLKEALEGAQA